MEEDTSTVPPALEPKVMAPFRARPGEVPRRVLIERARRAYRLLDVDDLFRAMPDADALVSEPHVLSLDVFDDRTYETRTPSEWLDPAALDVAANGGVRAKVAVYARANKTGHPLWAQGVVVGGDADRDVYHVRLDKNQKTLANVPRVDVCFNTEDPEAYARRRYAAYVARARATRAFRRELFVDCMPAESVPKVDERSAKRMVRLALNRPPRKDRRRRRRCWTTRR